ncbi:uncharacterized protein LOC115719896 isoform X1 [Cannabis sativa]|uniref:uncharacterized protein LOC115719896 isoform X1 n=1 Tax=Cannabis sativa TaxID=3483 RepID=UPI0029C9D823|nr:uncharacterized protein LOC115719896 isoform X1 [Cannabis sativa]XP_060966037.1 uncharacterized protein LOC115719896 isoform X1 [Cannabis sativa]
MALHSGIGFSKILVIAGTGYTTTVLFNNHKLSDLLGEKLFSEARERNKISRVKRERASIDNGVLVRRCRRYRRRTRHRARTPWRGPQRSSMERQMPSHFPSPYSWGHPWVQVGGVAPDKPLDSAVL